jgi:NAD+ kinase
MSSTKVIGIIYNDKAQRAVAKGKEILDSLMDTHKCWMQSTSYSGRIDPLIDRTDIIITVGGDGTILKAATIAVPHNIPILGINLGRLGFMTELKADQALTRIPEYLNGNVWQEQRSMIQVTVQRWDGTNYIDNGITFNALNDAVLGRGAVARLIHVKAWVDNAHLTSYRADAVIACTATGSTGYNLSAGGPILPPNSEEMILKPVAPHVGLATAVVLPENSTVILMVESDDPAILSVDGSLDLDLSKSDQVEIKRSSSKALFLRAGSPEEFYGTLTRRLGFEGEGGAGRAVFY